MLMKLANASLTDAFGAYYVRCNISGTPCSVCLGPLKSRGCVEGILCVQGWSGRDARVFTNVAVSQRLFEAMQHSFSMTGMLPWESLDTKGKTSEEILSKAEAQEKVDSALDGFPHDSEPLKESAIRDLCSVYDLAIKRGAPRGGYGAWDKFRGDAARGKMGDLAQRCAKNDLMWAMYKGNPKATAAEIKKRYLVNKLIGRIQQNADNPAILKTLMDQLMRL